MTIKRSFLKDKFVTASAAALACAALALPAQADYNFVGGGDGTSWEDVANWESSGLPASVIPGGSDYLTITGGDINIDMDGDSWNYFVSNSLLTGGTTGEYRTQTIRLAQFGAATLNIDIGDGNIWRTTNSTLQYVGSQNSTNTGVMNIYSGDIRIETSSFRIAEKTGSTGLVNISGSASTRLIISRESGGVSMQVGTGGNGTFQIDGGKLRTRAGMTVGSTGTFRVLGSTVTEVEIGSEGSLDGNWTQNAGGILEIGIDAGGVTQINIADKGGSGTFANFDAGAILTISELVAPAPGTWTVMEVQNGTISDGGLSLLAGPGWSYDVDNSGANGLLTVSYVPEPATLALLGLGGLAIISRKR